MNAKPETTNEPSVVGMRVRPLWSIVLYALLVVSAGVAMYAQRSPGIDPAIARISPWVFLIFVVGFSAYRIALVAAKRYSPFKAFVQILLASLFFLLLLFPRVERRAIATSLFEHSDSRVRSMAAEVVGFRGEVQTAHVLTRLLDDSSPEVRQAAHMALVRLNGGVDLGSPDDDAAKSSWKERFP